MKRSRVELTDNFIGDLRAIEAYFDKREAPHAYHDLLVEIDEVVVPNLSHFPLLGRPYAEFPPESAEALALLARWPKDLLSQLRLYTHGDYLLLYGLDDNVFLLAIRHHRQLTFDFSGVWVR